MMVSAYDNANAFLEDLEAWQPSDRADRFWDDLMGAPRARGRLLEDYGEAFETSPSPAAPVAVPPGFRMGVWLDVGGRSLASQGARHAALLHGLGFADACLMVNRVDATRFAFDAISEGAIRGFASLLAGSATRLTLTSWLRPDKPFIDELIRLLPPLAQGIGARAIEFDVESTWRGRSAQGFSDHTEAAEYFFGALRPAATGLEIAVTCEVDPMPTDRMRTVVQKADLVVPQAYSSKSHAIGTPYGPRGIQDRAVQRLAQAVAASGKPMIVGLAAYGRSEWRGTSADAIMRMELEQTLGLRGSAAIQGVRYWSWKHIAGLDAQGGRPANAYGLEFFRRSVSVPGMATAATSPPSAASSPSSTTAAPVSVTSSPQASPPPVTMEAEWDERIAAPSPPAPSQSARPVPQEPATPTPGLTTPSPGPTTPSPGPTTQSPGPTTQLPGPTTRPARQRVLQSVRVELPLTRERIEAAKLYDSANDTTVLRAVDARGASVDLETKLKSEKQAWLRRHRQIHPVLARALNRADDNQRIPILAWIFHEHELPQKNERVEGPLLAAREATALPQRSDRLPEDPHTGALGTSVRQALDRAKAQFQEIGVEASADLETVPVLQAEATKAQINALSQLPDVTGLYLHEPAGILDLATAMTDARAAAAHSAGFRGANVPVAVWEQTPKSSANLIVEETFDPSAAAAQPDRQREHAQLVTAIIKNKQGSASVGFAPDAKVYSANKFSNDALVWAVVTKRCSVVNQSFHRDSEQTDPGLSADDVIKDYLVLHPPFPTIVQAAGNGPATEYVNHKGFNSITVGNHEDGAARMQSNSVFKNPSSTHNDRELPDLSANGASVSATGLTMTGTSFASPAVAGSAAVIQSVDSALKLWPEGCRAILLASAGRNIAGGTWGRAVTSATTDGVDGSGALDAGEAARIARVRARRDGPAAQRGWDVGKLRSEDLQANGTSRFRYLVQVPTSGARRLKAALAWSSKVVYAADATLTPPVRVTESRLTVDLDLYVYLDNNLIAHSSTLDNSFEIVEFDAQPGKSYEIRIKRFSGTDWAWFGLAWCVA